MRMIKQMKKWILPEEKIDLKNELASILNISEILVELLIQRGYTDIKKVTEFLYPQKQKFHDPFLMKGMDKAVERIIKAISKQEKIIVYGDYDVDGISATSLLVKVLRSLEANVDFYIPERQSEGYGINLEALNNFIAEEIKLIVTVDCGISSIYEIGETSKKIDIIVTDHHQPPENLPAAFAILNPHQMGCEYPEKHLAGVGVAYKLCQALWLRLKNEEFKNFLDIAVLGTVADLMPLIGENRLIVALGIEQLRQTSNLGLKALLQNCNSNHREINTATIGFGIAPRLNAVGRLSSAFSAVQLLLTDDLNEAEMLAEQLENENKMRRAIQEELLKEAEDYVTRFHLCNENVLVIVGEDWNSGVIGLVASNLLEKYYKPTVVISMIDGIGKASCRSIEGFNIHRALAECEDILIKYGGHEAAAGFSILSENIKLLRQRLNDIAKRDLNDDDYIPNLFIDKKVNLSEVDEELLNELNLLEPYGIGNKKPVFISYENTIDSTFLLGANRNHLKFKIRNGIINRDCVFWQRGDLIDSLLPDTKIDIVFKPIINEWQGRKNLQFIIEDIRDSQIKKSKLDQLYLTANQIEKYADIGSAKQFFTKLVGVTFDNRQDIIRNLKPGEELFLERQPNNSFDANAILIKDVKGKDVGFLKADLAKFLAKEIDQDLAEYEIIVTAITGRENQSYGVNVLISKIENNFDKLKKNFFKEKEFTFRQIKEALIGSFEYHGKQIDTLKSLSDGNNTLTIMGTGRGKSAIFQSYAAEMALMRDQMTIIVYPLRALVNDQYIGITKKLMAFDLNIYKGNGTLLTKERAELFTALQFGKVDILLTTPEFLLAHLDFISNTKRKIGFLVIDECHHIADGAKRSAYKLLNTIINRLNHPKVLAVTATADSKTVKCIKHTLSIKKIIIDKTVRENLMISDLRNMSDKIEEVNRIINKEEKVLVFVNSRMKAVEIASQLREKNILMREKIAFYHAGLSNEWRAQIEDWFRNGEINVVVATSAFGEGIDLPDIRHIVLFHLPFDMVSFNQQCGRAGRDGIRGMIHLLYGKNDISFNQLILKEKAPIRDLIARVYMNLKANLNNEQAITSTNEELAKQIENRYHEAVSSASISICLRILEELGLIWRETFGNKRKIVFNPQPDQKLDLESSSTFCEGIHVRAEFESFANFAMTATSNRLLNCVNRPIYPLDEETIM